MKLRDMGFLLAVISVGAIAKTPEPRYSASIREGENLVNLMEKNAWFKDFKQSNLYQGLLLRSGSVLGALPQKKDGAEAWTGRFADFVVAKIIAKHPLHFYYFHKSGLVEPFGIAIQDVGEGEQSVLDLLIKTLRGAANQKVEGETLEAIPLSISRQKFALVINGNCLGLSRDPTAAVWSAQNCLKEKTLESEARVIASIESLSGGTERAVAKYFGIGDRLEINFNGVRSGKPEIQNARLALSANHRLKNSLIGEQFLKALPASTQLMSSVSIPAPAKVSPESFSALLGKAPASAKAGKYFAATYFFLGSFEKERNLDGLLIDVKSSGADAAQWTDLFEGNLGHEVFVKDVCSKSLVVVTPSNEVIKYIEQSCAGKMPTLAQAPALIKSNLSGAAVAQTFFLNLGKALSSMVEVGWNQENTEAMAQEVIEAKKLLEKIPAIALSGQAGTDQISFKATAGAL